MELAVCRHYRVFHSEFLARSQSDRDKAIWDYQRWRSACPDCGTRPDEWDPDKGGHRRAYRAVITDCEGCIVIERAQAVSEMQQGRGKKVALLRNDVEVV